MTAGSIRRNVDATPLAFFLTTAIQGNEETPKPQAALRFVFLRDKQPGLGTNKRSKRVTSHGGSRNASAHARDKHTLEHTNARQSHHTARQLYGSAGAHDRYTATKLTEDLGMCGEVQGDEFCEPYLVVDDNQDGRGHTIFS